MCWRTSWRGGPGAPRGRRRVRRAADRPAPLPAVELRIGGQPPVRPARSAVTTINSTAFRLMSRLRMSTKGLRLGARSVAVAVGVEQRLVPRPWESLPHVSGEQPDEHGCRRRLPHDPPVRLRPARMPPARCGALGARPSAMTPAATSATESSTRRRSAPSAAMNTNNTPPGTSASPWARAHRTRTHRTETLRTPCRSRRGRAIRRRRAPGATATWNCSRNEVELGVEQRPTCRHSGSCRSRSRRRTSARWPRTAGVRSAGSSSRREAKSPQPGGPHRGRARPGRAGCRRSPSRRRPGRNRRRRRPRRGRAPSVASTSETNGFVGVVALAAGIAGTATGSAAPLMARRVVGVGGHAGLGIPGSGFRSGWSIGVPRSRRGGRARSTPASC